MISNITNAILGNGTSPSDHGSLADALCIWRKKVGYYSMFAALPAILTSQAQDARADVVPAPKPILAGQNVQPTLTRGSRRISIPPFLRRHAGYRLPHQRPSIDLAWPFSGTDDCPGTPIAGGNYTATAPYSDSGNTTGANNTVTFISPYYSYEASGPDHVYSFTLAGLGANPQIEVSTTSGTYRPMIYLLYGNAAVPCPSGTGNSPQNASIAYDSRWNSGSNSTATLGQWAFNYWIPLNVPLYLFVDSRLNDAAGAGPYTVRMQDVTIAPAVPLPKRVFDFDGDGKADVSFYRPGTGVWHLNRSTAGAAAMAWGTATDKIAPADYDRDGKADLAVFRPSNGGWYILKSNNFTFAGLAWGVPTDVPVSGDFDLDGKADVGVFRPSDGTWYIKLTIDDWGSIVVRHGQNGDVPVTGHFIGDETPDIAVFRPSNGTWYIKDIASSAAVVAYQYGLATDKVVPADYDGDGKTDIAVYRPSEGRWYIANSGGNPAHTVLHFGAPDDIPVPADYDGDGKTDIAIFRPSDGNWWINRTTAGLIVIQWGQNGDKPTPNAFVN